MGVAVFSKKDQVRIDKIIDQIHVLEKKQDLLRRKIEEIKAGQSPIQPGDMIEWKSGNRTRKGRVRWVSNSYGGWEYHCVVLTGDGKICGSARVGADKEPTLVVAKKDVQ